MIFQCVVADTMDERLMMVLKNAGYYDRLSTFFLESETDYGAFILIDDDYLDEMKITDPDLR
jgi:hypothetical protein